MSKIELRQSYWNSLEKTVHEKSDLRIKMFHFSKKPRIMKNFFEAFMEEKKAVVTEKSEFEFREKPKMKAFLEVLDYQQSDGVIKIERFSIESSLTFSKCLIDAMIEKNQDCSEREAWMEKSKFININGTFWSFWSLKTLMQVSKQLMFWSITHIRVNCFWLRHWWKT